MGLGQFRENNWGKLKAENPTLRTFSFQLKSACGPRRARVVRGSALETIIGALISWPSSSTTPLPNNTRIWHVSSNSIKERKGRSTRKNPRNWAVGVYWNPHGLCCTADQFRYFTHSTFYVSLFGHRWEFGHLSPNIPLLSALYLNLPIVLAY